MKWFHWLGALCAWTILSVLFAPELYLYFLLRKENLPWANALVLTLANTAIALVLVPGIVWLALRFPMGKATWRRSLFVHIPMCLVFSLVHSGLYAALCFASPMFEALFARFHPNLITYWAVIGFVEAVRYFNAFKERDQQLARAQLDLLRAQLQPHFLFNSLNTISAMMHRDVAMADRMLTRLSDLLRMALENIGKHEAPLRSEIEFIRSYLEIENVRFGGGIRFETAIDPALLDAKIPSMMLQPLVENSVRHGYATPVQAGTIRIEAERSEAMLILRVVDDGIGPQRDSRPGGAGIPNTRARLEQLYAGNTTFQLLAREQGGAVAEMSIPFAI